MILPCFPLGTLRCCGHHDPRQDPRLWQRALVAQELSDLRKRPEAEPSGDDDVEMALVSGGARQFPMETHVFFASEVDRIQWRLRDLQETMGKTNEKKGR